MEYRLPILKIIKETLTLAWINKEKYLKSLFTPILLLVFLEELTNFLPEENNKYLSWLIYFSFFIPMSIFAVTCHRLILIKDGVSQNIFRKILTKREIIFFIYWVILILAIWLIYKLFAQLISYITMNSLLSESISVGGGSLGYGFIIIVLSFVIYLSLLYISARLCLVFPTIAIDKRPSLSNSWNLTNKNGWRIVFIVFVIPCFISFFEDLIWRDNATILENAILSIFIYIIWALEIFALSISYREIIKNN